MFVNKIVWKVELHVKKAAFSKHEYFNFSFWIWRSHFTWM